MSEVRPATKIAVGLLPIIALVGLSAFTLPMRAANDTLLFRSQLALTLACACIFIGSGMLFIISLKLYKAKMRRAFATLAVGILLTALSSVQLPVATAFGLENSFWIKSGLVIAPFLLGGLALYIGIRGFAQLVGTPTILTRAEVAMPAIIALSLLSIVVPHVTAHIAAFRLDGAKTVLVWTALIDLTSSLIVWRVKQRIGAHYTVAMLWLWVALASSAAVGMTIFARSLFDANGVNTGNLSTDVLVFLTSIGYLGAGYVFAQTEDY